MSGEKVKHDKELVNKSKDSKNGKFREKEFKPRNSLLTDLLEIQHFKSIRHLFLAMFISWLMNNIFHHYYGPSSIKSAFVIIKLCFNQFDKVILMWSIMFASTLALYPLFSFWATFRFQLSPKSLAFKLWDPFWMGSFLMYYIIFLILPPYVKDKQMYFASSAVVLCEQVRLLMKMHAFVRSNAPRILSYHTHSDEQIPIPAFSTYFYFLFVPTLVYRDSYPRTEEIRWSFVLSQFVDFLISVVFLSIVVSHGLLSPFRNYPSEFKTWQSIVLAIFNAVPVAMLMTLSFHYLLLHCWQNMWAEILTFADRQFYSDWWNVTSFSAYYRKWNGVIHDFLYEYIYRDFYETIASGNRLVSALSVFVISAIVHEHIISSMVGFFYPVLMAQFLSFGVFLTFIKVGEKQYCGNVFMWFGLFLGVAIVITLLAIEYYARVNCPRHNTEWTDFFIPRSWSC